MTHGVAGRRPAWWLPSCTGGGPKAPTRAGSNNTSLPDSSQQEGSVPGSVPWGLAYIPRVHLMRASGWIGTV
jgi:hypothetical protein